MSISFDNALGIHARALEVRVQRAEVLANNLANADTPGFKARDIDFKAMLAQEVNQQQGQTTGGGNNLPHAQFDMSGQGSTELLYRTPSQPAVDGNTVDTQQELAEFTKNAMDYQASFQFLNSKFKGLMTAIKGE